MKKMSRIICMVLSVVMACGFIAVLAACPTKTPPTVTITFEYSMTSKKTITVEGGKKIPVSSLPEDPKPRDNNEKIFRFWSDDNSRDFVKDQTADKDVTLRPVFRDRNAGEYVVWFNPNGGSYIPTQVILAGNLAQKPDNPTRPSGEKFEGWTIDDANEGGGFDFATQKINKDYYLKASWEEGKGKLLIQSSGAFDGVFSPFFGTSAYDNSVTSDTQVSLISSDHEGQVYVGEDVPTVAKDLSIVTYVGGEPVDDDNKEEAKNAIQGAVDNNESSDTFYTEYQFVIKNNIQFSDGEPLTIKDILFNMYVYLDPIYSGSSTLYSTNIIGLQSYRLQDPYYTEDGGSSGTEDDYFSSLALERRLNLQKYFNGGNDPLRMMEDRRDLAGQTYDETGERNKAHIAIQDLYELREIYYRQIRSLARQAWATEDVKETYGEYGFEAEEYWKVFLLLVGALDVEYTSDGRVKEWVDDGNTGRPGYPQHVGDPHVIFHGTQDYYNWGQEELTAIIFNNKMGILNTTDPSDPYYAGNYNSALKETLGKPRTDFKLDANGLIEDNIFAFGDLSKVTSTGNTNGANTFIGRLNDLALTNSLNNNTWSIAGSSSELFSSMMSNEKTIFYESLIGGSTGLRVKTISGISVDHVGPGQANQTFKNADGITKTYDVKHDILKIRIKGVDPKAIWNFGFSIAPMHYYSNPDGKGVGFTGQGFTAFNYEGTDKWVPDKDPNLGFVRFNDSYMKNVMRNKEVQGIPVGAGPFKATDNGGADYRLGEVKSSSFFTSGWVHFRRNSYFRTTGAAMNNVQFEFMKYKVIDSSKIMGEVASGAVSLGAPNAKQENITKIENDYGTINYELIDNNGYGYVGVNPKYVPDIQIRKAIMTALDTRLIPSYFDSTELCTIITRPMSMVNWAYPTGKTDRYPYQSEDAARIEIENYVTAAGFKEPRQEGALTKDDPVTGGKRNLKFTFTVSGSTSDHPAYDMFLNAATLLNSCGFNIEVKPDPYAISRLSTGSLEIWAAAWSSTVDPDMYQVYHKKSRATSTKNWGYEYLLDEGNATDHELTTINALSDVIDEARLSLDNTKGGYRADRYAEALDLVMELAVEYPTYQRKNLIIYNSNVIDGSSLVEQERLSPYYGLFAEIWNVRLF